MTTQIYRYLILVVIDGFHITFMKYCVTMRLQTKGWNSVDFFKFGLIIPIFVKEL
jgi:hypothetical protein